MGQSTEGIIYENSEYMLYKVEDANTAYILSKGIAHWCLCDDDDFEFWFKMHITEENANLYYAIRKSKHDDELDCIAIIKSIKRIQCVNGYDVEISIRDVNIDFSYIK